MFEHLQATANGDPNIRRLGRTYSGAFDLTVDETPHHVRIENGVVQSVEAGPFRMRAAAFRIAASADVWREFMSPRPSPGRHDIFAMSATGNAKVDGDIDALLRHLAFFKALLECLRREG